MATRTTLPRFLRQSFSVYSSCLIRRVPIDVLLDHILLRLSVAEILRLRRVDKAFFILTHSVTIWKRFFRALEVPTPFFYEGRNRYAFEEQEYEYERLVAKCVSLDDTWHSLHPRVQDVNTSYIGTEVMEMKVMPGGQYMVASVRRRPQNQDGNPGHFGIAAFRMHGAGSRVTPTLVLSLDTFGLRAYQLQTRFMMLNGRRCLVLSFVTVQFSEERVLRRRLKDPLELPYKDIADLVDKYTWHCGYIGMAELTEAGAKQSLLTTWWPITHKTYEQRISCLSLFMLNDKPFAVFIKQPDIMVTCRLDAVITFVTQFPMMVDENGISYPSATRAIRPLPAEGTVLVIRSFFADKSIHQVHVYRIGSQTQQHPLYDFTLEDIRGLDIREFTISEPPLLCDFVEDHGVSTPPSEKPPLCAPPPISIYAVSKHPMTLRHFLLYPAQDDRVYVPLDSSAISRKRAQLLNARPRPPMYKIDADHVVQQPRYVFDSLGFDIGVLPGVYRPLVYNTVEIQDTSFRTNTCISDLRRYQPRQNTNKAVEGEIAVLPRRDPLVKRAWQDLWRPTYSFASLELIPQEVFVRLQNQTAFAAGWDETSGRLCLASAPDLTMTVVDIGRNIERSSKVGIWKEQDRYTDDDMMNCLY